MSNQIVVESDRDYENDLPFDQVLRHTPVMPRIIRIVLVVALQPEIAQRHLHSGMTRQVVPPDLDYAFTDMSPRVDGLGSKDDIPFFDAVVEEFVEEPVNY